MGTEYREIDVLVTGGSLEGCIAAAELAKKGKKVLLTEKSGSLGGIATNGLENVMHPEQTAERRAAEYAGILREQAGEQEGLNGPFYHDQKAKVVLARMLKEAGVTVLTHIFPYEIMTDDKGVLCRTECKAGTLEIRSRALIDGEAFLENASMAGLPWQQGRKCAEGSVKWNGIPEKALKEMLRPGYEEGEGYLMGSLALGPVLCRKGIRYCASEIRCRYSSVFGETIFTGIRAELPEISAFTVSDALAGLRIYAYMLRDYLREQVGGCEKASIIHVAPMLGLYGIRQVTRQDSSVFPMGIFPMGMEHYSNEEAIRRGVETGALVEEFLG